MGTRLSYKGIPAQTASDRALVVKEMTGAFAEPASPDYSVGVLTKQCVAIRLRLYEHAIRLAEDRLPDVPKLNEYLIEPSGPPLASNLFVLSKQLRNRYEEAGLKGDVCARDVARAELLGARLLCALGRVD